MAAWWHCVSCSRPTRWARIRTACRPSKCRPPCCCRMWRRHTGHCFRGRLPRSRLAHDDGGVIAGWSGSMADARFRTRLQDLLAEADIRIDGPRPWDLQIHEPDLPARLLAGGSLALGESYMDAAWDAASLDGFLHRLLAAGIDRRVRGFADLRLAVLARLFNLQRGRRSYEVGERHYDLGNELYAAMLGSRLVYSCGYWRDARQLGDAPQAKLDLCCRKLGLQPGMRLLDIGCGWGEMLRFAAERYGVSGVGVTISSKQAAYARELCAGFPVEIRVQDYRELDEGFDRIVSI